MYNSSNKTVDCPVTLTVKKIFHFLEFEIHENEKNKQKKDNSNNNKKMLLKS